MLNKKIAFKISLTLAFFVLSSCEYTKSVWQDTYQEKVNEFLISYDDSSIVFVGEKYHYSFPNNFNKLKQLFELERNRVILINSEKTKIEVHNSNIVFANICFQSYDYNLSAQQLEILNLLGFVRNEEEFNFETKVNIMGTRYLGFENPNLYFLISQNIYDFDIKRNQSSVREVEKVIETPFAVIGDSLVIVKEIVASFFKE